MENFCSVCGRARIDLARFCSGCGKQFSEHQSEFGLPNEGLTTSFSPIVPPEVRKEEPASSDEQTEMGDNPERKSKRRRSRLFGGVAAAVVLALVAAGGFFWVTSRGHVEPTGRASTMTANHWGLNNPWIVEANADSLWIRNFGGGIVGCASYNDCPYMPSQFPRALMKFDPNSGLLEKAFVAGACPRQIKLSGRTVSTTCSSQSIQAGLNEPLELQQSTCQSLRSAEPWTISADSRYVWLQLADSKFVQVDAASGRCWNVSLSFGTDWKYGSAWAVSDGETVWIGEPSDRSSFIAVDEATREIKYRAQLPMSLRSNFVLSAGKLWFSGVKPSKNICFLMGKNQPCKESFALFALNPTNGRVLKELSSARYGFGVAPMVGGFGTLDLSADGDTVWVAAADAGNAIEVDAATNTVVRTMRPSKIWHPLQVVGEGKYFYVVLAGVQGTTPETVNQYETQTGQFVRKFTGAP